MKRVAGIATIKGREESLQDTIDSLSDQMDEIHVFNGDEQGDSAKFNAYRRYCHYFSCDDDLIYPPDYADRMIDCYDRHSGSIITCHGRKFIPPITNYYKNGIKYHCLAAVEEDTIVDCGGTGVMMFTGQLNIDTSKWIHKNMADIWIAIHARQREVPIVVMKHYMGWIQHSNKFDLNLTIHSQSVNNCEIQTQLINTIKWQSTLTS